MTDWKDDDETPPGFDPKLLDRAMRSAWSKAVETTSNIDSIPPDIVAAAQAIFEAGIGMVTAIRLVLGSSLVPSFEPPAWGPYVPPSAWPDNEWEFTPAVIARYERCPWVKWRNRHIMEFQPKRAGDPVPVRKKRYFWRFIVISFDGKGIANAVECEAFLRSIGFRGAFAEGPTLVTVRKAVGDEVHRRNPKRRR